MAPTRSEGALIARALTVGLLLLACAGARPARADAPPARAEAPPGAVISDPPKNAAHPARMEALQIISHGEPMNAVLYVAAGGEPHPAVVLLHGLPGNEQNLDLAQSIRRAGWSVLTMHYRGSWGSGGRYSLTHCLEDARAAVAFLREPKTIQRFGLQAGRIVVMGHSMGGFLAAKLGAEDRALTAVGMIAAWDVGHDGPIMAKLSEAKLDAAFADLPGRVVGATGRSVVAEAAAHSQEWTLAGLASGLANHELLVVTARGIGRQSGRELVVALRPQMGGRLTDLDIDTDHSFSDSRIELQAAVVRWLDALPNVPASTR